MRVIEQKERKAKIQKEQMAECTFAPKISARSKQLRAKKDSINLRAAERYDLNNRLR